MITKISQFVNSDVIFYKTINLAKQLDGALIYKIFNKSISFKNSKFNYDGYKCCGVMSYSLAYVLSKQYPDMHLDVGFTRHDTFEHLFIKTFHEHTKIIIDPTYKQFDNNNLADRLPFFVGTMSDLQKLIPENNIKWWDDNATTDITFALKKDEK